MPMQPVSNIKIEEGGLTLGLSEAQVNERVKSESYCAQCHRNE